VSQGVGPEFKHQYHKKQKTNEQKNPVILGTIDRRHWLWRTRDPSPIKTTVAQLKQSHRANARHIHQTVNSQSPIVACYSSENQCQPEFSGVETPLE
jgi:hypothetical protein